MKKINTVLFADIHNLRKIVNILLFKKGVQIQHFDSLMTKILKLILNFHI